MDWVRVLTTTILSGTIRLLVIRLITLYAYAWSFHNIDSLHSYIEENKGKYPSKWYSHIVKPV